MASIRSAGVTKNFGDLRAVNKIDLDLPEDGWPGSSVREENTVQMLKVNDLSKVYGTGDTQIKAIDGVSFSVETGAFDAIVGPSGLGKSTLLHILGGVDTPSAGQVLWRASTSARSTRPSWRSSAAV